MDHTDKKYVKHIKHTSVILHKNDIQKKFCIFIFICLFTYTCLPLLTVSLYNAHDIGYHLNRIEGLAEALKAGQFPARIHPNILNDYGYANSIFYPELFLYFPAVLRAAGVEISICYKLLICIINALCVSISIFSFRRIFKSNYAAYLGAIMYSLSLYRLLCIYVRGALGEALAMSFLPLGALGIYEIFIRDSHKWHYIAIAFTCVMQSHIITAELFLYVSFIMAIIHIKRLTAHKFRRMLAASKAALSFLLLNLWFLIPFCDFVRIGVKITGTNVAYWRNTVTPPPKIFSIIFPVSRLLGTVDNMPYTIGFSLFVSLFAFAVLCLLGLKKNVYEKNLFYIGKAGFITSSVCIFMSTCLFPWIVFKWIPVFNRIASSMQFPWRLLSVGTVSACITAVSFCLILKSRRVFSGKIIFAAAAAASLICANILIDSVITFTPYFARSLHVEAPVDQPSLVYGGQYALNGTDIDMLAERGDVVTVSNPNINLSEFSRVKGALLFSFSTNTENETHTAAPQDYIEVPLLWYPHYASKIDGVYVPNEPGENNVIRIYTGGRSSGKISVCWEAPVLYRISEIISVLFLIFFIFLTIKKQHGKHI